VTEKDLKIETFHAGGPGGQNQNKRETGVRITHLESGAIGEARDSRSQLENKKQALIRMANTLKFKLWVRKITNEIFTGKTIEEQVEDMMKTENLKFEIVDENGRWIEDK
jgi:protein subunit release factor B